MIASNGSGSSGRVIGKRGGDVARLHARENRIAFRVLEVIGNPVDELVPVAPEGLPVHLCVFT